MFRFLRPNQNEPMAVTLKPEEAYLHIITGGFYNERRRKVRQLFARGQPTDDVKDHEMENIDIAVGILEEFYSINVPTFTLRQAVRVIYIFKLEHLFASADKLDEGQLESEITEALERYFSSPRMRLSSSGEHAWTVPDETQISKLKIQFCKRDPSEIKAILDAYLLTQVAVISDDVPQSLLGSNPPVQMPWNEHPEHLRSSHK